MTEIRVGDVLVDRYRVERLLGAGGMGMVLAARHILLDELYAIKIVRPELAHDEEIVRRFLQEAQSCVRLKSPHVAKVTDVHRLPEGEPFMVMEYLTGQDLGELLKKTGRLPILDAVNYVVQACDAIGEAHAIGILHRDLKPANLFLTQDRYGAPLIKVLDFGISKVLDRDDDEELTRTTVAMGTPPYMPPEQFINARHVTARSDIWSLGCVLYRILTNELPFRKDENTSIEEVVKSREPKPPRELRPEIPEALEAVILRCLRKKKDERFATASALADALCEAVGLPLPTSGPAPTPRPKSDPPPPPPPPPPIGRNETSTVPEGGEAVKKPVDSTVKGIHDQTENEAAANTASGSIQVEITTHSGLSTGGGAQREHTEGVTPSPRPKRDLRALVGGVVFLAASGFAIAWFMRPARPDEVLIPIPSAAVLPPTGAPSSSVVPTPPAPSAAPSIATPSPSAVPPATTPRPPPTPPPTGPRPSATVQAQPAHCNPQKEFCPP